jgi:WhiB family redox-sensing transcriptional regulator
VVSAPAPTVTPATSRTTTAEPTAIVRVRQVWQAREVGGGKRLVAAEVARELGVSDHLVKLTLRTLRAQREQQSDPATVYDRIERLYRTREQAGGQHLRVDQVAAEVGANPRYVAGTLYVLRALDRDGPPARAQWAANRQRSAGPADLDQLASLRRQAERDTDGDWRAKAACATPAVDPEVFFPEAGEGWKATEAKQVCAGCTVRDACLHEALTGPQAAGEDVHGIFGGTSQQERRRLRGRQSLATPTVFSRDREQAANALELARQVGIVQASRQLGVSTGALYSAWDHHGLGRPQGHCGSAPSVFLTDRAAAERAFQRARQVGITAAAKQAGVNHQALRKAWQRHGLGLPERAPQQHQPAVRPLSRAFLTMPGNEAFGRPAGASPARLAARARRLEELETLGPRVAYEQASENRPRRAQTRAWVITRRGQQARELAAERATSGPADNRQGQVRRRLLEAHQRRQATRTQRATHTNPRSARGRTNPAEQERER